MVLLRPGRLGNFEVMTSLFQQPCQ
jgi:hypothetical protein